MKDRGMEIMPIFQLLVVVVAVVVDVDFPQRSFASIGGFYVRTVVVHSRCVILSCEEPRTVFFCEDGLATAVIANVIVVIVVAVVATGIKYHGKVVIIVIVIVIVFTTAAVVIIGRGIVASDAQCG